MKSQEQIILNYTAKKIEKIECIVIKLLDEFLNQFIVQTKI